MLPVKCVAWKIRFDRDSPWRRKRMFLRNGKKEELTERTGDTETIQLHPGLVRHAYCLQCPMPRERRGPLVLATPNAGALIRTWRTTTPDKVAATKCSDGLWRIRPAGMSPEYTSRIIAESLNLVARRPDLDLLPAR